MKTKTIKTFLPVFLCLSLLLCFAGCGKAKEVTKENAKKLGEGENNFYVLIEKENGDKTAYEIFTDQITVGDALYEQNLIKTEKLKNGGSLVVEIDGNRVNYTKDHKYWAVSSAIDGVSTDVFELEIMCNETYIFSVKQIN